MWKIFLVFHTPQQLPLPETEKCNLCIFSFFCSKKHQSNLYVKYVLGSIKLSRFLQNTKIRSIKNCHQNSLQIILLTNYPFDLRCVFLHMFSLQQKHILVLFPIFTCCIFYFVNVYFFISIICYKIRLLLPKSHFSLRKTDTKRFLINQKAPLKKLLSKKLLLNKKTGSPAPFYGWSACFLLFNYLLINEGST